MRLRREIASLDFEDDSGCDIICALHDHTKESSRLQYTQEESPLRMMPRLFLFAGLSFALTLSSTAAEEIRPAAVPASARAINSLAWITERILTPDETSRYTQGVRLRRLESAWIQASSDLRKEAIPIIQQAVRGYFAGQAREVSRGLDRSIATLSGNNDRDYSARVADALDIVPLPALIDPSDPTSTAALGLRLAYPVKAPPTELLVQVRVLGEISDDGLVHPIKNPAKRAVPLQTFLFQSHDQGQLITRATVVPGRETLEIPLHLPTLRKAVKLIRSSNTTDEFRRDLILGVRIEESHPVEIPKPTSQPLREQAFVLSLVPNLSDQITRIREAEERLNAGDQNTLAVTLPRSTLRQFRFLVEALNQGPPRETDRPIAHTLNLLEPWLASSSLTELQNTLEESSAPLHHAVSLLFSNRPSTNYLSIPTKDSALNPAPVRIGGATQLWAKPGVPVVVALHGAGGSENMFHDAYGLGLLERECRERGWLFLAPRLQSPADDWWPRIEPLLLPRQYRGPVAVVGHSMGSLASVEGARRHPHVFQAIAAISVGSRENVSALKNLPVLVAAGVEDFGRSSSRRLYQQLTRAGAQVQWLETPSEHLMVVADALPETLVWLDQVIEKSGKPAPPRP